MDTHHNSLHSSMGHQVVFGVLLQGQSVGVFSLSVCALAFDLSMKNGLTSHESSQD